MSEQISNTEDLNRAVHLLENILERMDIEATVGFKVETFSKSKINFTCFDMSGQGKYRKLWEQYYDSAEAVIFVVDADDRLRISVA